MLPRLGVFLGIADYNGTPLRYCANQDRRSEGPNQHRFPPNSRKAGATVDYSKYTEQILSPVGSESNILFLICFICFCLDSLVVMYSCKSQPGGSAAIACVIQLEVEHENTDNRLLVEHLF